MSGYVQLGEAHAYYEEDGDGEPLVLLHPGLADSRAFEEYVPALAAQFRVFRPDRRGHGRTPDVDGPITYEVMAEETIAFLERVVGGPAYLLGHSDGAPVALLVALKRPDLVRRLVFSAGVSIMTAGRRAPSSSTKRRSRSSSTTGAPSHRRGASTSLSSRPSSTACTVRSRRSPKQTWRATRACAGDGRRPRRGDSPRAPPRAFQGIARRPARRPARHRPWRHRHSHRHRVPHRTARGDRPMIARSS